MREFRSKAELEAYLQKSHPAWWNTLPQGRENVYECDTCRGFIVTIDIDRGVTPMRLVCMSDTCNGSMTSYGYPARPKPEHIPDAQWEWYRPEVNALGRFDNDDEENEHILRGGLLLRGIKDGAP